MNKIGLGDSRECNAKYVKVQRRTEHDRTCCFGLFDRKQSGP